MFSSSVTSEFELDMFVNLLLFFDNGKYSQKTAIRILEEMNTRIKEDSITYKSIIGANFSEFKFILKGCLIGLKIGNKVSAEGLEEREQYIYQNLRKIINENPNVSFYIKAGRAHVSITTQKRWLHLKDWKSVAARLNTNFDSPVIGKVCSVVFYYSNNLRYEENHRIEPIIKKEDIPLFLQYSTTPLTLFKLDGENTPFKEMAEKFQYLIIDKY